MRALKWAWNLLAVWGGLSLCWIGYDYVIDWFWVFPWHWEEKIRLASPSGDKELLGFQGNRGAMSSYRYSYFIVKRGEHIDPNANDGYDSIFVCSGPPPKPVWTGDDRLGMSVGDLRVFYYEPRKKEIGVSIDVVSQSSTQ